MEDEKLLSRITLDPNICHGKPTIRSLRYPVESILEYLSGGDTIESILEEFPDLELPRQYYWRMHLATATVPIAR